MFVRDSAYGVQVRSKSVADWKGLAVCLPTVGETGMDLSLVSYVFTHTVV